MNNREFAKILIDQIPEGKLPWIIAYLQGAAIPDQAPDSGPQKRPPSETSLPEFAAEPDDPPAGNHDSMADLFRRIVEG